MISLRNWNVNTRMKMKTALLFKISWFYFKEVTINYLIMYLQPYFFLVELQKMSKGLPI